MESYKVECRTSEGLKVTIHNVFATNAENARDMIRRGFPNLIVGMAKPHKETGAFNDRKD